MRATTEPRRRLPHLRALDGLRGIAVLLVVGSHVGAPLVPAGAGDVGVTVFFTLSGYLITTLLCQELEETGRVSFRRFYARRARRLLPALLVVVAVVVTGGALTGVPWVTWPEVVGALFFCTSVLRGFVPVPSGALHHTWSLGIEEQFYVVWPVLCVVLWRRRRLLLLLIGAGASFSAYQRFALLGHAGAERLQFSLDTRVDAILIGCALALLLRSGVPTRFTTWGGPGLLWVGVFAVLPHHGTTFLVGLTVVSLGTVAAIAAIVAGQGPRWLELAPLRAVGRVSYGLYLWHYVALFGAHRVLGLDGQPLLVALLVLPASAALSWLSWRYVEQPFLRPARSRVPAPKLLPSPPAFLRQ